LLESPKYQRDIFGKSAGSALKNLAAISEIKKCQIPLPPIAEQRRIAAILDKADAIRRKRKQAIQYTEELLRATFLDMFGDTSSKTWEVTTVAHLSKPEKGSIRTGPFGSQLLHGEFVESGVAVLGIDNAVQNQFSWAKPRFITPEKYKKLRRYRVFPGDVLITIMGTCGRCAIVPYDIPESINTKHLCCISLDEKRCLPEFLHSYFLIHPMSRQYLDRHAKGAVMDGLNMGVIKKLPVSIPPLNLQQIYKTTLQSINNLKVKLKKQNQESDNLFNSLLQRAFRGEL
jgi:type I restriction enzyme S subunit